MHNSLFLRRSLVLVLFLLPIFLLGQSRKKIISALDELVKPIASVDLMVPANDLAQTAPYWQNAKILALGEATHGTHEFFAFKARMIKYAIENQGFRIVAFEAPFDLRIVNQYVQGEEISLNKAMKSLGYWVWQSEEVSSLLAWLRDYNQTLSADQKVRFVGIDMQSFEVAKLWLDWNEKFQWDLPEDKQNLLTELTSKSSYEIGKHSSTWLDSAISQIIQLESWTQKHQKVITESIGNIDYLYSLRYLEVLQQGLTNWKLRTIQAPNYWNYRDSCMAANALWLIEEAHPNEKVLLWAHNGHIVKWKGIYKAGVIRKMGLYLANELKDQYYALGMGFAQGAFYAAGPTGTRQAFSIHSTPKKSLPAYLEETKSPMLFLDWQTVKKHQNLSRWSQKQQKTRQIGAGFDPAQKEYVYLKKRNISDLFDGWFFVRNTTAAKHIITPNLEIDLSEYQAQGKELTLQLKVKPQNNQPESIQPRLLLFCWTQTSTLARHQATANWDSTNQYWELMLNGHIPEATTILKLKLMVDDRDGFEFDDLSIGVKTTNEVQQTILSHDFEMKEGTEKIILPEGFMISREASSALSGQYGARVNKTIK